MSYFFWLLFIRLFNYEKAKIRHFPNIFTPFGVGKFTGVDGDIDIYLTIEETKIWTKSNYFFLSAVKEFTSVQKHGGGMEVYLTTEELAVMLKLSEQTIRRYVLNKVIPFRKIKTAVRFRLSEIEKWINGGCADNFVISDNTVISNNSVIGDEAEGGLFPETTGLQETDGGNKEIL